MITNTYLSSNTLSQVFNDSLKQLPLICDHVHDKSQQSVIKLPTDQVAQLRHAISAMAPHKNSGRGNPVYFMFKYLSTGCIKYERFNPSQTTMGYEIKSYGYDKTLDKRHIKRLWANKLKGLGLFNVERLNNTLNRYTLTDLGKALYWYHIRKNRGDVFVDTLQHNLELSTDIKLAESQKEAEIKKCPQVDEKNVPSYIESSYIEYSNNLNGKGFNKSDQLNTEEKGEKVTFYNLEHEVGDKIDKTFAKCHINDVKRAMARVNGSLGYKLYLIEDIASGVNSMRSRGVKVDNVFAFALHKHKMLYEPYKNNELKPIDKPKRKHLGGEKKISPDMVIKHARPGESYQEAEDRLNGSKQTFKAKENDFLKTKMEGDAPPEGFFKSILSRLGK